jgi:transcriptional regulator
MYLPKHFNAADEETVNKLIELNPFVTLLSYPKGSRPFINHLPIIFETSLDDKERFLIGHMARRSPQWTHFKENSVATIIVHGPHTYITPNWYRSGRDVPTWNYAVAHIDGSVELVEDFKSQVQVLKKLTSFFEGHKPGAWKFELPEDLQDEAALTSAIISFRFIINSVEAKFKLSQNRSAEDKTGVIQGLSERADDMSRSIREMMVSLDTSRAKK